MACICCRQALWHFTDVKRLLMEAGRIPRTFVNLGRDRITRFRCPLSLSLSLAGSLAHTMTRSKPGFVAIMDGLLPDCTSLGFKWATSPQLKPAWLGNSAHFSAKTCHARPTCSFQAEFLRSVSCLAQSAPAHHFGRLSVWIDRCFRLRFSFVSSKRFSESEKKRAFYCRIAHSVRSFRYLTFSLRKGPPCVLIETHTSSFFWEILFLKSQ